MTRDLERFNSMPDDEAFKEFLSCCGSQQWANKMMSGRPFDNVDQLKKHARDVWWKLEAVDWLEAFRSHPRIGERKAEASASQKAQQWSSQEQSGLRDTSRKTLDSIAELNLEYEARFGYIFIVCATGKSSEEMLAILRQRLVQSNNATNETRIKVLSTEYKAQDS